MAVASAANAGPIEDAQARLTGDGEREWLSAGITSWMSSDPACASGEVYAFKPDGTVTIRICMDSTWKKRSEKWSLNQDNPLDIRVTIGADSYLLLFATAEQQQQMILRTLADSKVNPTVDREFYLSED
ncbi:hypothetical protein GOL30_27865 [Sinorhizobium medicae]|uniref:hypothetical protein n=1 Tax=Sinorhizobium TaxID=28105 RepID=UPI000FD6BB5E|nr:MULTISPECIES: hypothetical protein [Sinorhizobium]MCO5966027.1 hypothetical protein [Sinorhizobium meliloti]MDW9793990.1 hypothetical protein [Sinorhizobium meliloti]MDX0066117.1 hypothetical protein [Sinorhizobium meliloti]MDX0084500.1 hypothetical protein [Sinorhizobium meliloti]MDX0432526.1 hypothetical protein [Sinorhizobium medicae]